MALTEDDIHALQHSLGIAEGGKEYRNYYCDCLPSPQMGKLIALCLMVPGKKINDGKAQYFYVTEIGKQLAYEELPTRPRLTSSKKRYLNFLNMAEVCPDLTFKKFLTHPDYAPYRDKI